MYHLIFVYTYLLLGVYLTIRKVNINPLYLLCLSFVSFKVIFEYRVCSVAYMECRLRDVKREESYMNKFLEFVCLLLSLN